MKMFVLTLVMIALATAPIGFGIGQYAAHRSRTSIRPMYRSAH